MAIKIQTKQTGIPIEFGEHTFYYDTSDESILNFHSNYEKVMKELDEIHIKDAANTENMEAAKDVLRKAYNMFLGEDAFDKIYAMSPSVIILMNYLVQMAEGIEKEINGRLEFTQQEKAQKYLKKKNKKK